MAIIAREHGDFAQVRSVTKNSLAPTGQLRFSWTEKDIENGEYTWRFANYSGFIYSRFSLSDITVGLKVL